MNISFTKDKISFKNEIKITNLNFSYSNDHENISKDINLKLKKVKI